MKHIEKKKLTQRQLVSLILAGTFVILAIAAAIAVIVINKTQAPGKTPELPEILEGEGISEGLAVAYPPIEEQAQLEFIEIRNPSNQFGFVKIDGENHFTMFYYDADGERQVYYPQILVEDATVNYKEFYAVETSDGFSRYTKLDYLCLALQDAYFAHRIPFAESEEDRVRQFKEYGLDDEKCTLVQFQYTYKDESGASHESVITLRIGSKSVSGTGFYFTVNDRPYIYSSSNNYYEYTKNSFTVFLKPLLVADGLEEDKGFGPYLTPGYYQWKNEFHGQQGEAVAEDSRVIFYADILESSVSNDPIFIGYEKESGTFEIDLSKYSSDEKYRRMINALTGAKNGAQDIVFSLSSTSNKIDFGDAESKTYQYKIIAVEAILTDENEISVQGSVCGSAYNLIKVTYTSSIDGKETAPHVRHAVIDLRSAAIPAAAAETLRNTPVGTLSEPFIFDIEYTKQNTTAVTGKYIITEIIRIFDEEWNDTDKVSENSIVCYRYRMEIDGKTVSEATDVLELKGLTDAFDIKIKEALIGKEVSANLELSFGTSTVYGECFENFVTYKISRIDYFITKELVAAFRFQNSSNRDPYYGESLYENLTTGKKLYGVNQSACEYVTKLLGGLSDTSTSATASGFFGDEVVAIGLTPEIMKKYGLYANSIYYELPRSIYSSSSSSSDSNSLDDWDFYDKIGFNIYISDIDYSTNTRYIASDMYDIVTRVSADDFSFLNYDFETMWARKNLVLIDVNELGSFNVDFNMSDLSGSYFFDLIHNTNATYETSKKDENGDPITDTFHKITVSVTPSDMNVSNKLVDYMKEKGYTSVSLSELYKHAYNMQYVYDKDTYPESIGTEYFKEAMLMLYLMAYVDIMPEDERAEALSPENMLLRMTFEIDRTSRFYTYEFYRADDRRILIKMYSKDSDGNASNSVSDFYISSFAFKKIVSNLQGLLNAEKIDPNIPYTDIK